MPKNAESVARELVDLVWNGGSERMASQLIGPSAVYAHDPLLGPTRVSGMSGERPFVVELRANRTAMPDLNFRIRELVATDDRAVVLWQASGTHTGELRISGGQPVAPAGRAVRALGWTRLTVEDGQITSLEQAWSPLSLVQQLALLDGGMEATALLERVSEAMPA